MNDRRMLHATSGKRRKLKELPSVINLNVGGTKHATRLTTLRKYPDSMLAAMFSGRHNLDLDKDGNIFIDRNGEYFNEILEFLRDEKYLPPVARYGKVLREADFYGLVELADRLKKQSPLFPAYNLLERNREQVADYFTIKEKILEIAKSAVVNRTKKTHTTLCSTQSDAVGSITTSVKFVTFSSSIQYTEKKSGWRRTDGEICYQEPTINHVASFEEGMDSLSSSFETVATESKNVTDYKACINTLINDFQEEGYSLSVHENALPTARFVLNGMQYHVDRSLSFVFNWNLIKEIFK